MIPLSFLDAKCCAIWFPQMLGPFMYSFLSCLFVILYKRPDPGRELTVKLVSRLVLCIVVVITPVGRREDLGI